MRWKFHDDKINRILFELDMRKRDVCPLTLPELVLDTKRHEIIV
jgi:hypothetical protein